VHTIGCDRLPTEGRRRLGHLAWGDESDGGTARLCIVIKNEPGSLAVITGILGTHGANIVSLDQTNRGRQLPHLPPRYRGARRSAFDANSGCAPSDDMVSTAERL
jgi:(p)ppGpp synthase/HD superfamily hydrolase